MVNLELQWFIQFATAADSHWKMCSSVLLVFFFENNNKAIKLHFNKDNFFKHLYRFVGV